MFVNGKRLTYWGLNDAPVDNNGNPLVEGDLVFHVSGTRSRTYSIKTVINLKTDCNPPHHFLGVRLDNGQYSSVRYIDCFKVDQNFANQHSKLISKSHEVVLNASVYLTAECDSESFVAKVPKDLYQKYEKQIDTLLEEEFLFCWEYRGSLQNEWLSVCVDTSNVHKVNNASIVISALASAAENAGLDTLAGELECL